MVLVDLMFEELAVVTTNVLGRYWYAVKRSQKAELRVVSLAGLCSACGRADWGRSSQYRADE